MTQTTTPDFSQAYSERELIQPYKDDPCLGNLSTPINDSDLVRLYSRNLPAYREGLSPLMRGLEIGMAHGYFLIGPEIVFGTLRETSHGANLRGVITAIYITASAGLGISIFAIATFQGDPRGAYNSNS
ncbi:MAG: photosystem I reaction center subunit XI, partial [Pleurocapsa sp.]